MAKYEFILKDGTKHKYDDIGDIPKDIMETLRSEFGSIFDMAFLPNSPASKIKPEDFFKESTIYGVVEPIQINTKSGRRILKVKYQALPENEKEVVYVLDVSILLNNDNKVKDIYIGNVSRYFDKIDLGKLTTKNVYNTKYLYDLMVNINDDEKMLRELGKRIMKSILGDKYEE